jgi:hypothetical protein
VTGSSRLDNVVIALWFCQSSPLSNIQGNRPPENQALLWPGRFWFVPRPIMVKPESCHQCQSGCSCNCVPPNECRVQMSIASYTARSSLWITRAAAVHRGQPLLYQGYHPMGPRSARTPRILYFKMVSSLSFGCRELLAVRTLHRDMPL